MRVQEFNFRFVKESEVTSQFAVRLHEVCGHLGIPAGRGRQTALAGKFGVSPNAARKWLLGEGMPELAKAIEIASAANVNILWLLQGVGPKRIDGEYDTTPGELLEAVQQLPADDGQQVFDFIRYKFERADGWYASEQLARYMVMLDRIAAKQPEKKPRKP